MKRGEAAGGGVTSTLDKMYALLVAPQIEKHKAMTEPDAASNKAHRDSMRRDRERTVARKRKHLTSEQQKLAATGLNGAVLARRVFLWGIPFWLFGGVPCRDSRVGFRTCDTTSEKNTIDSRSGLERCAARVSKTGAPCRRAGAGRDACHRGRVRRRELVGLFR